MINARSSRLSPVWAGVDHFEGGVAARLSKTMRPQSVRTCYGLLRGPLRRAVRDRVITDPCIDIVLPKLPDITKTFDDVLTAEERRGEPTPASDAGVLRGGALDRDALIADAETNFAVYGFYGLSVWVPADAAGEDALLATKLLKSRIVRRFLGADLIARGLELWETGQSPHYDLVYLRDGDVDDLVDAVIATSSTTLINPHHDPDGGADR